MTSRRRRVTGTALVALMALVVPIATATTASAGPPPVVVEKFNAEAMHLPAGAGQVQDSGADGKQAVAITKNGTAWRPVTTPEATSIQVFVKAVPCNGSPQLRVKLDGALIAAITPTTTWKATNIPTAVAAGTHRIDLAFNNDVSTLLCSRAVRVDR